MKIETRNIEMFPCLEDFHGYRGKLGNFVWTSLFLKKKTILSYLIDYYC